MAEPATVEETQVAPLVLENVSVQFGGLMAVDGVDLTLAPGERRAVIGPNGAGKTTLFKVISGEQPATTGRVTMLGHDVTTLSSEKRARLGLGRTYQLTTLFRRLTVRQNVAVAVLGRSRARLVPWRKVDLSSSDYAEIDEVLARVALDGRGDREVSELSHGEQRQLELALGLASKPKVLLLDEPAAGLSSAERGMMRRLLRELPADLALVLVEHDMSMVLDLVDKVLVLDNGKTIADTTAQEVVHNEDVQRVYLRSDFSGRPAAG